MSTSIRAYGRASRNRNSSRKSLPNQIFAGVSIACLVAGCGWTVYTNILSASVYPQLGNANYDAPVVRQPVSQRTAAAAISSSFAELYKAKPVIAAPASVSSEALLSFEDRFAAAAPQGVAQQPEAPKLAEAAPRVDAPKAAEATRVADAGPRVAAAKPVDIPRRGETPKLAEAAKPKDNPAPAPAQVASVAPRATDTDVPKAPTNSLRDMAQRAKAAVMSIASGDRPSITEKLWGKSSPSHGSLMAYASADASATGSIAAPQNPALGGSAPYDRSTAVYDISAHMVYLPDGSKLEAHSGLGSKLDDPRSAPIKMHGVTPPHIYELTPREALFHGVPALRLNPVGGESAIYGRAGLLAHTYMLGPNGDSNGCVSFRDYNAFLNAYRNQGIKRLAVVARVE
jgi:Protein of unknown function (DUF2778)